MHLKSRGKCACCVGRVVGLRRWIEGEIIRAPSSRAGRAEAAGQQGKGRGQEDRHAPRTHAMGKCLERGNEDKEVPENDHGIQLVVA